MDEILTSDQPAFWQQRYQAQNTPWDLGHVAPPFKAYWEEYHHITPLKPGQAMAVVGCGNGHDAAYFAQQGFAVTGMDYAPLAIQNAHTCYGDIAQFLQADIFDLPADLYGTFDIVLEHTCFCAIRPQQRADYVQAVSSLLRPNGYLLGLFWDHGDHGGPPYTITRPQIERYFKETFTILSLEKTPHAIPTRYNQEWLALMQKMGSMAWVE